MNPTLSPTLCCAALAAALAGCGGGGEIGGTVSGLGTDRSVTLANNGSDELTVTRDGRFAFADNVAAGGGYAVSVATQPVGQECVVANGSGTVNDAGDAVDSVRVTCSAIPVLVGTLAGLRAGLAVTLIDSGRTRLALTVNGPFAFPGRIADGTAYDVQIDVQPLGSLCIVSNGRGSFLAATVTRIAVDCE